MAMAPGPPPRRAPAGQALLGVRRVGAWRVRVGAARAALPHPLTRAERRLLAEMAERRAEARRDLLGRIVELSGGRSLETNIALVRNNARLGAALAVAYAGAAPR